MPGPIVEWVASNAWEAPHTLAGRAVVGGHDRGETGPLWVIRAKFAGEMVPGKLATKRHEAYVPWGGKENSVMDIEVCCAFPGDIEWVDTKTDQIPPKAVVGGYAYSGELMYIGRAKQGYTLTPGKVQPSRKALCITYDGVEVLHKTYEILCTK